MKELHILICPIVIPFWILYHLKLLSTASTTIPPMESIASSSPGETFQLRHAKHVSITLPIRQRCLSRKCAIIWYDDFMLQYSIVCFFGRAESSTGLMMWNIRNTTSPDGQNYGALALIYSLIDEAPYTDMMFGTEEKCTRDISSSSFRACLGRLTEQIKNCCQNTRGWRILSSSCYLRYEESLFYQQSMAPVSPVPVMPQPMPNDGGRRGTNTTKIAIITVSSTLAAVGGALLGFRYNSSSCRKQRPIGA
ncbi:hypothetical protein Ddye_019529 [Dipteronia dyeriana]|uniref:Gnk2-homologous domain-containing protein n=1 Tax=Dipteronia dyeriana TaxID=168575 RepID=A0AAD9TXY7_9ROSI|nr:hypothetical protein Ddye_019529 [Dipteronia dyeriana]